MSKEEILFKNRAHDSDAVKKSMDEYAQQEAIGFLQWADKLHFEGKRGLFDRGFGMFDTGEKLEHKTTQELFNIYKTTKV